MFFSLGAFGAGRCLRARLSLFDVGRVFAVRSYPLATLPEFLRGFPLVLVEELSSSLVAFDSGAVGPTFC